MLFGDRIGVAAVQPQGESRSLLGDAYESVLVLAERIGVLIVPGDVKPSLFVVGSRAGCPRCWGSLRSPPTYG